jgi:hypothetical protein
LKPGELPFVSVFQLVLLSLISHHFSELTSQFATEQALEALSQAGISIFSGSDLLVVDIVQPWVDHMTIAN